MIQSKRLEKIYALLPEMDAVIDVGCDHGYLEELLLTKSKVKKVIATDISSKSLEKTQKRMEKLGLIDKVELICCDGLQFEGQSKSNFAIIAGIGGIETINIVDGARESEVSEFILLPVQNAASLREYLISNNFFFLHDETIFEKGKYYSIIHCKKSKKSNWSNKNFGVTDILNGGADFKRFIERELKNLSFLDGSRFSGDEFIEKRKYKEELLKLKGE